MSGKTKNKKRKDKRIKDNDVLKGESTAQRPDIWGYIRRLLIGKKKSQRGKSVIREYSEAIVVAVLLALVIRTFVIQAFRIPSGSMEDTLLVGDFLLAEKITYGPTFGSDDLFYFIPDIPFFDISIGDILADILFFDIRLPGLRDPKPRDIIIFEYPEDPSRDFIKRCVAVAGQTVEIRDKKLYVDGKRFPDPPQVKYESGRILTNKKELIRDNYGPRKLKEGELFMMGDNRDNSQDSRFWGPLPMENVKAKALIIYGSWNGDWRAPKIRGPGSLPAWLFYHITHFPWEVRWGRIGDIIR